MHWGFDGGFKICRFVMGADLENTGDVSPNTACKTDINSTRSASGC